MTDASAPGSGDSDALGSLVSIARMAEAVRAFVEAPREAWDEHAWATYLAAELRVPVGVVFTRSRRTPVAVRALRDPRDALEVRLHRLFADTPVDVRAALSSWLRSGRRAPRATDRLDAFIAEILRRAPPPAARRIVATPGKHHDIEGMARELLAGELKLDFPAEMAPPTIVWGRRNRSRTRHSLRLGSYDPNAQLVRIHPVLDQPAVPDWFVRFVVFHELLHAVFPIRRGEGQRWIHHGRAFRQRERAYVDHDRAHAWERAHLARLIRSARTGEPLVAVAFERAQVAPVAKGKTRKAVVVTPAVVPVRIAPALPTPIAVEAPNKFGVLRLLQQMLFPDS